MIVRLSISRYSFVCLMLFLSLSGCPSRNKRHTSPNVAGNTHLSSKKKEKLSIDSEDSKENSDLCSSCSKNSSDSNGMSPVNSPTVDPYRNHTSNHNDITSLDRNQAPLNDSSPQANKNNKNPEVVSKPKDGRYLKEQKDNEKAKKSIRARLKGWLNNIYSFFKRKSKK